MPDIFDEIAPDNAGGGDIFDEIAPDTFGDIDPFSPDSRNLRRVMENFPNERAQREWDKPTISREEHVKRSTWRELGAGDKLAADLTLSGPETGFKSGVAGLFKGLRMLEEHANPTMPQAMAEDFRRIRSAGKENRTLTPADMTTPAEAAQMEAEWRQLQSSVTPEQLQADQDNRTLPGRIARRIEATIPESPQPSNVSRPIAAVGNAAGSLASSMMFAPLGPAGVTEVMFLMELSDAYDSEMARQQDVGEPLNPDKAFLKANLYAPGSAALEYIGGAGRLARRWFGLAAEQEVKELARRGGPAAVLHFFKARATDEAAEGGTETLQRLYQDAIVMGKPNLAAALIEGGSAAGGSLLLGGLSMGARLGGHKANQAFVEARQNQAAQDAITQSGQAAALMQSLPMEGTGEVRVMNRAADESFAQPAQSPVRDIFDEVASESQAPQTAPVASDTSVWNKAPSTPAAATPAGAEASEQVGQPVVQQKHPVAPPTQADQVRNELLQLPGAEQDLAQQPQQPAAQPYTTEQALADLGSVIADIKAKLEQNQIAPQAPAGQSLPQPNAPQTGILETPGGPGENTLAPALETQPQTPAPPALSTPAKPVTPPVKRKSPFVVRPRPDGVPDILDAIQEAGGMAPLDSAVYGNWRDAFTGPARMLIRKGGRAADKLVDDLSGRHAREGEQAQQAQTFRVEKVDDIIEAVRQAVAVREKLRDTGGGEDAQAERFWTAISKQPTQTGGLVRISADQLQPGDKFRLRGPGHSHEELEVRSVANGVVTLKDGKAFGWQEVPEGTEFWAQKKGLELAAAPEQSGGTDATAATPTRGRPQPGSPGAQPQSNIPGRPGDAGADGARRRLERDLRAFTGDPTIQVALGKDARNVQPGSGRSVDQGVQSLAKLFGVRVDWWHQTAGKVNLNRFNGWTNPDGSHILLNVATPQPHLAILGHELIHTLSARNPELYAELIQALRPLYRNLPEYDALKRKIGYKGSLEAIEEEFIADFAASQFNTPAFWERLHDQNPSVFKRTLNRLLAYLDKLIGQLTGQQYQAEQWFSDVTAAREVLAGALARYAAGKNGGAVAGGKMSVEAGQTAEAVAESGRETQAISGRQFDHTAPGRQQPGGREPVSTGAESGPYAADAARALQQARTRAQTFTDQELTRAIKAAGVELLNQTHPYAETPRHARPTALARAELVGYQMELDARKTRRAAYFRRMDATPEWQTLERQQEQFPDRMTPEQRARLAELRAQGGRFSVDEEENAENTRLTKNQKIDQAKAKAMATAKGYVLDAALGTVGTFWRNGVPPESGYSYNFRDQHSEAGVSVYPRPNATSFAGLTERPWYRITGKVVGRGSDGEPVVEVINAKRLSRRELDADARLVAKIFPTPSIAIGDVIIQERPGRETRHILVDEVKSSYFSGRNIYELDAPAWAVNKQTVFADEAPIKVVGSVLDFDPETMWRKQNARDYLNPIREEFEKKAPGVSPEGRYTLSSDTKQLSPPQSSVSFNPQPQSPKAEGNTPPQPAPADKSGSLRNGHGMSEGGRFSADPTSEEFQAWFGGSKVVDAAGRPLLVKHGTPNPEFSGFNPGMAFFTNRDDLAQEYTSRRGLWRGQPTGKVVAAYLALKNPLMIDALGKRNDNIPVPWQEWKPKVFGNLPANAMSLAAAAKHAQELGHDGMIVRNVVDTVDPELKTKSDVYVAFHPEQIRLPDASGRFSADDLFGAPESVAEQREREKAEKRKSETLKAKETMRDRAQARLTGSDIDTTKEMFGAEVKQDKAGQGSLFSVDEDGRNTFQMRMFRGDPFNDVKTRSAVGTHWSNSREYAEEYLRPSGVGTQYEGEVMDRIVTFRRPLDLRPIDETTTTAELRKVLQDAGVPMELKISHPTPGMVADKVDTLGKWLDSWGDPNEPLGDTFSVNSSITDLTAESLKKLGKWDGVLFREHGVKDDTTAIVFSDEALSTPLDANAPVAGGAYGIKTLLETQSQRAEAQADKSNVTALRSEEGSALTGEDPTKTSLAEQSGSLRNGQSVSDGGRFSMDDLFGAPESVAEQKERLKAEAEAAKLKKAKETMRERAGARLTGKDLDTTKEMFGAEVKQDKAGQGSLFSMDQADFDSLQEQITAAEAALKKAIRQHMNPPQGMRKAEALEAKNAAASTLHRLMARQLKQMTSAQVDAARSPEQTAELIGQTVHLLNSIQDEISERTARSQEVPADLTKLRQDLQTRLNLLKGWADDQTDEAAQGIKPTSNKPETLVSRIRYMEIEGATNPSKLSFPYWHERFKKGIKKFLSPIPELPLFGDRARFTSLFKRGYRLFAVENNRVKKEAAEKVKNVLEPLAKLNRTPADNDALQRYYRLAEKLSNARKAGDETRVTALAEQLHALETTVLNKDPFNLFRRLVLYRDFYWRGTYLKNDEGKPIALPGGLTPDEVLVQLRRITKAITEHPDGLAITEALRRHYALMEELRQSILAHGEIIPEALNNPTYFPHLLTEYYSDNLGRVNPTTEESFRKYLITPVGSERLIQTDYIKAVLQHTAEVLSHNARADLVEKYWQSYDISEQLKEQHGDKWDRAFNLPPGYSLYAPYKKLPLRSTYILSRDVLAKQLGVLFNDGDLRERMAGKVVKVKPEDLRTAMVAGEKIKWALPTEIVDALHGIEKREAALANQPDHAGAAAGKVVRRMMNYWKQLKLFGPTAFARYSFGNLTTDAIDKVLVADPKTAGYMRRAARELWRADQGEQTPEFKAASREGVFETITAGEVGKLEKLPEFREFMTTGQVRKAKADKVAGAPAALNSFRESTFRYAKFLADVERLRAGEEIPFTGMYHKDIDALGALPNGKKAVLEGEELIYAKAAENSLRHFGDYNMLAVNTQWLRRYIMPFVSWTDVNLRYHVSLAANMVDAFRPGATELHRTHALRVSGAKIAMALAFVGVAKELWNQFGGPLLGLWDDEDDLENKLSPHDRRRAHIILGKDAKGEVMVMYTPSAFGDVAEWVGGQNFKRLFFEYARGDITLDQWISDYAKQLPVDFGNKLVQSTGPVIKGPYELASDKATFPDIFDQRTIPKSDKWWRFVGTMTDDRIANWVRGVFDEDYYNQPMADQLQQIVLQVRRRDPQSWAYYEIKEQAAEWEFAKTGKRFSQGDYTAPEAMALRNFRRAIYRGDVAAADQFYHSLLRYGYTAERLDASIRNQAPLAGLNLAQQKEFKASMDARTQQQLALAEQYYAKLKALDGREKQLFPKAGKKAEPNPQLLRRVVEEQRR